MKASKMIAVLLAAAMLFAVAAFTVSAASLGDLNSDGKINATDYIKLKRHVLKSRMMTKAELEYADINGDGRINSTDYIMLKRHVLGTYKIGQTTQEKTAIDKIISAIGNKENISITYVGTIAGFNGTAEISFSVVGGVLTLRGHAVTDEGATIDLSIPMPKISETYSFNGEAALDKLSGKANGSLNAAQYTIDEGMLKDITITSTIEIPAMMEKQINGLCKEALDQFLYQANNLLEQEKVGVTIADLGFTQFYQEIQDGLMDM